MTRNWSDERKAQLTLMWNAGSTSGEISAALGDVSRNAVMGMVNRLGLMKSKTHAESMKGKRTGCCAPGWSRSGVAPAAAETAVDIGHALGSADPAPVSELPEVTPMVQESVVTTLPIEQEASSEPVGVIAVEQAVAEDIGEVAADQDYVSEGASDAEVSDAAAADADVTAIEAADAADEMDAASAEPDPLPEAVLVMVAPMTEDIVVTEHAEAEAANDDMPAVEAANDAADVPNETVGDPVGAANDDADTAETANDDLADETVTDETPSPVERIMRIRAAARRQTEKRPVRARVPSSRSWSPSRMPPSPRTAPPPQDVTISSGVISGIAVSAGRVPDWRDAFSLLERLTGVSYDERVPGHVPALVAIATVMSKGDPRRVLSPRIPEQSVLRVMRRFAERGAVVAGKPPERWLVDVDDQAFYKEMVEVGAAA